MAQSPFIWGAGGQQLTPDQVERLRQSAGASAARGVDTSPVGHWSQGLARLVDAFGGYRGNLRANEQEAAGLASADAIMAGSPVLAALGGVDPAVQASGGMSMPSGDRAAQIRAGLIQRGLPEHIADGFLMNFQDESGLDAGINERNPIVPGSRGGFGLYQLTGPRRTAYENYAQSIGAPLDSTDAQLDFLMQELQGSESAAAKNIFATQDAGQAAAAIVNDFLRPAPEHRASRTARYTGGAGYGQPQPSGQNVIAALSGAQANPWVQQKYGKTIEALMGQEMGRQDAQFKAQLAQQDPAYQLGLQKAQLELDALRNPAAPKPIEVGGVLLDPTTYQPIFDSREQKSGYTQLSPEQAAQFGLDPSRQWQVSGDNKIEAIGGTPLVQNNLGGEKQWDQESAKLWAKRYDGMVGGASNARDMLSMYDLAESAINSGVRTGFGASQEQALRKMAAGLGIGSEDAEKLAGGELLNTVQNRMALMMRNPDGGMGMPGAMSDADRKFLRDSQVGLDRTPEGNRKMLAAFRAMEQRKIEISELADQYITENGMLDQGFNKIVKEYAEANPMFKFDDAQTGAPARINSKSEFDALPSGATFIAPDGTTRRKP